MVKDISREIEIAQEYLEWISSAINRDKLLLEEWQKHIASQEFEISELDNKISVLKQKVSEYEVVLSSTQDMNSAEIQKLNDKKLELQAELANMKVFGDDLDAKLNDMVAFFGKEETRLKKEQEINVSLLKDETTVLEQIRDRAKDEVTELSVEKNSLVMEIWALEQERDSKQNEVVWVNKILADILEKQRMLDNLESDLKSKEEQLFEYNKQKNFLSQEIQEAESNKNQLISELNVLVWEKDKFIQERISLDILKDQLAEKEDYIKTKFTSAGLNY